MSIFWIALLCLTSCQARDSILRELDRTNLKGPHFRKYLESPTLKLVSGGVPVPLSLRRTQALLRSQSIKLGSPNHQSVTQYSPQPPSVTQPISAPQSLSSHQQLSGNQEDGLIQKDVSLGIKGDSLRILEGPGESL